MSDNKHAATTYHVWLTPLNKFFFGGEKTFGLAGNDNYLIRSEKYPQQTALLGMLRQTLLEQSGLLGANTGWQISDKDRAKQLIGPKSFRVDDSTNEMDFGAIQMLSPVFLMNGNEPYYPCPLDSCYVLGTEPGKTLFANAGGKRGEIPALQKYDPKIGLSELLINTNGKKVSEEHIFRESEQTGVWKNAPGEAEEEGYYKQYFYKLNANWQFAFYVEIDTEKLTAKSQQSFNEGITTKVTLGRERSPFQLEIRKQEGELDQLYFPSKLKLGNDTGRWHKIVLLSDALVTNEVYEHCFFGVTDTKDFRCITTNVDTTTHFSNLTDDQQKEHVPMKSEKFNLLKRGSVLYVNEDQLDEVTRELNRPVRFRQIGYNWYGILNASFEPPKSFRDIINENTKS